MVTALAEKICLGDWWGGAHRHPDATRPAVGAHTRDPDRTGQGKKVYWYPLLFPRALTEPIAREDPRTPPGLTEPR